MRRSKFAFLSVYPRVFNIVYALPGENIRNKKVAQLLGQGKEFAALKLALSDSSRRHKYLALILYFCQKYLGRLPPLSITLYMFQVIGPARSWFSYLQNQQRPSLLLAEALLKKSPHQQQVILEAGCGIGQIPQLFPATPARNWICIDKNFFSLFLAQLYHRRSDITYVCGDIELQRVFPTKTFTTVTCVDCFDYIFEKKVFIQQMHDILKPTGNFMMINIHEEQPGTENWGYGIDHTVLKKMLLEVFQRVEWHEMSQPERSLRQNFANVNSLKYSFVAWKH